VALSTRLWPEVSSSMAVRCGGDSDRRPASAWEIGAKDSSRISESSLVEMSGWKRDGLVWVDDSMGAWDAAIGASAIGPPGRSSTMLSVPREEMGGYFMATILTNAVHEIKR